MNQPEHHGREHALTGIGLFVEMLALLFGEYWLGLGAAVFLWLAVLNYTRSYTTKWKPVYQNGYRAISALIIAGLMCAPPYFKERASKKPVTQAAGAGSSSISQVSAAPTPDPSPNSTPSVSPARIRPATKLLPRPVRTASALPLPTPQPYITNNAPGGFATSGGTLINPQVINNGPPPAKIVFIEEVISPISLTGGGEKIMKIHITTDRSIPGAIIGIIFSGPFDLNRHTGGETLDEPTIKNAVMFQVNWTFSAALSQGGSPIPNSASVAISSPAAFLPGQELIVPVRSKTDVHVLQVMPVTAGPQ